MGFFSEVYPHLCMLIHGIEDQPEVGRRHRSNILGQYGANFDMSL
jgi:hypothetical protein